MFRWPIEVEDCKYKKWYEKLIINAVSRPALTGYYTEKHHIIPKCIGGSDAKDNLAVLLPREHYIAHLLLWKMKFSVKIHNKMTMALRVMVNGSGNKKQNRSYLVPARLYDAHRKDLIKVLSETLSGAGNPFYGKTHSDESKKKIIEANIKTRESRSSKLRGVNNHMFGKKHSQETLLKIGEASKKLHTPERKMAYSERMKQRWQNSEYANEMKEKMAKINANKNWKEIGRKAANTRKRLGIVSTYSEERKEKIKEIFTRTKQCEHCLKEFRLGNYARWHGDNCKHNKQ